MHTFPQLAWSPYHVLSVTVFCVVFWFALLLRPLSLGAFFLLFFVTVAFVTWNSGPAPGLLFSALTVGASSILMPAGAPPVWTIPGALFSFAAFASAPLLFVAVRDRHYPTGLVATAAQLRLLLSQVPAITWSTDCSLRVRSCYTGERMPGRILTACLPAPVEMLLPGPAEVPLVAHRTAISGNPTHFAMEWMGDNFQVQLEPIRDARGNITGVTGIALADEGQEQERTRAAAEIQMLKLVARSLPLSEALEGLTRLVENYLPSVLCAILLVDERCEKGQQYIAPSLPERFRQGTEPLAFRLLPGPCTESPASNQRLITTDITHDPEWAACHQVAREHNLPICRSVPVCADDGRSLAALVFFQRTPRELSSLEFEITTVAIHIARILIERDRAQQRLEANEQRYRSLFEHNPDAVFSLDRDGMFLSANPAAGIISGYDPEELVGSSFSRLVVPEYRPRTWRAFEQAIKGRSQDAELVIFTKQGHLVHLHVTVLPMVVNNEIVGLYGLAKDVTARRRAEESQQFLVEASRILTSSLDYETTLRNVANQAISFIADCCVVDIVNEEGEIVQLASALANDVDPAWAVELQQLYASGVACTAPVAEVIRTGRPILSMREQTSRKVMQAHDSLCDVHGICQLPNASYMIVPLVARDQTLGAISLFSLESNHDYTEEDLVLAEELAGRAALAIDNARLYHEAEQAIRVRDQFFSIASHELKTPVTSLVGFTQLLNRQIGAELPVDTKMRRALDVVHTEAVRLNRLIDLLLDVTRIQEGDLQLEREPVDLLVTLERTVEFLQPSLEKHQLDLRCAEERVVVEGDELRLEQVFQNLVLNAVKYSPEGGRITITLEQDAREARIAISDEGIGIPPDALSRLFDRYYRAGNVDSSGIAGMGLGLHIVQHILDVHDGTIDVTSEVGTGSTFTIAMPLLEPVGVGGGRALVSTSV